jgi:trk system potassium uptake protein TrkH
VSAQAEALRYAVRFRVLIRYFGRLCLIIAFLMLMPALVCLLSGDYRIAAAYLAGIGVLAGGGFLAGRLEGGRRIQTNEALVLAASSFLVAPAAAVIPFSLSGLPPVDAVFEAVSGITTTGLTMLDDVQAASPSLLFGRAWLQWYGGLGIVVFSLVLILPPGVVSRDMAGVGDIQDDLLGGVTAFARRALRIYIIMTGIAWLLLWAAGAGALNAVFYALSAVSTGGFAPHNDSAAALPAWPVTTVLMLIFLAGSFPMLLYIRLRQRSPVTGRINRQIIAIVVSAAAVGAVMILDQALNRPGDLFEQAYHLFWLAFSAQTTSGFTTLPVSELGPASKLSLMVAMSVGGGLGSTAGGIKVIRLLAFLRLTRILIYQAQAARHAVLPARFMGRSLAESEIQKFLIVPLLFGAVVVVSWLPFTLCGYPAMDVLFDVVSATGTVGLSTGVTGKELPGLLKLVLCVDMLLGRLEIIAWLVVLSPKNWIGRRL